MSCLAIIIMIEYLNYNIDFYSLVLWPLMASLTGAPEHFPSWTRNGHEYRSFSLRRRTQQPWYSQQNHHISFRISSFVSGDNSAHLGCSDIHFVALLYPKSFCNPPGFSFSSEGGDSGDMLMLVPVGGRWFALRQGSGHAGVPLLLRPCEIESGSWLSPKSPKHSQCFLLTPCTLSFAHMLHHTPSVLSRIWTTSKFQNQSMANTEIFLSVLKGLHSDKVAVILSYLKELSTTPQGRNYLLESQLINKNRDDIQRKKRVYLSLVLLEDYFRKRWMQIMHECNYRFQEIT